MSHSISARLAGILSVALLAASASVHAGAAVPMVGGSVHSKAVCSRAVPKGYAHCHAHVVVDAVGAAAVTATPSGYGPADLRDAYKIVGTGLPTTTIAIVDAFNYPNAEADLAVYRAQFGLPECTTANGCFSKIDQNGGTNYPKNNVGWAQEMALDLDMASAICPNCKLILVESKTNSLASLGTAVNTAASIPGVLVISNSYGGGEGTSAAQEHKFDHPGIAVTASSGDNGFGVEFPASSPHVIAVGGTTLKHATNARGWNETAWSGAGSGCSTVYAKPVWQLDTGCAMRSIADVSAVANPATGVAVYAPTSATHAAWMVFGGTSVSAPLIGAIYAVNGGTSSYASDLYAHIANLYDVKRGKNGSCGNYLCQAGKGYDGPTGLGTPKTEAGF